MKNSVNRVLLKSLLAFFVLFHQGFAAAVQTLDEDVAKVTPFFYNEMAKTRFPLVEQGKLGKIQIGEVFNENGEGIYLSSSGISCSTVNAEEKKKTPRNLSFFYGFVYCSAPFLREQPQEFKVALLRTKENNPVYTAGLIEIQLSLPKEDELAIFKEGIARRWGGAVSQATSKGQENNLDSLCDTVSLRTATARAQRDRCLANLDSNPFAGIFKKQGQTRVKFQKNGITAEMTKQSVNFMMARGDVYTLTISSDAGVVLVNKINANLKQIEDDREKIKREQKLNNF
jgi:hypothetical protein